MDNMRGGERRESKEGVMAKDAATHVLLPMSNKMGPYSLKMAEYLSRQATWSEL
jgi:hypothetical protein